jgi:hypothetical protein
MDKATIVGIDGKPRFELSPDNNITDLRDFCSCQPEGRQEKNDGEQRVCLNCGLHIK